mmetsp:Transcript_38288/g.81751  ORF Transcript_38288/g.81751 Transcript_38288/m.81751 type:complete len:204 (+) Transcript_38288:49-660(+)|eukprot:CAMPEP_0172547322 /NCGR_PEP_ID=MMETSP1067-20121228/16889_1 /TAXON_ID=265564 ORGANISM="Thalassiosira punctigera, Strain Tpunct2005C2" /NCGR_SAMPLE_ID=MMETSP1067 /ASSEMBLY_ACC=CAM_ASM_000444 /LENGTH=203 /DNA_ID=CAMNT_0013334401 /DNA_START=48 /DNA_END=659 /DNA_ORIENTATION=-
MPVPSRCASHQGLVILLVFALHSTKVHSFNNVAVVDRAAPRRLHLSSSGDDDETGVGENSIPPAGVTLDDGGSDLTDRFKYKVHALMGSFDPPTGAVDDENQTGNIIGAMLQFPTEYTFTVVGKNDIDNETEEGEGSSNEKYANDVKKTLSAVLGSDAKMEVRVVPRGKKFTRVSAKVNVESASVISSIYDELDALEATVMKF